ncbi:PorT family protein [Flaviaesturariibacter flavus]|uniref:PorT family protein n=1 Tax=Flaviaesturariibacter flavus TaxID=2502780 RepID=A0A4R1B5F7_9BACT|nr:outer membrane beta-barrel protein [Flaviaesturariibacter flavus]TCJ13364.1 PorT family protein [Flaviaesturariibacter flavus]
MGAKAQFMKEINMVEHEAKPYYFGITLAGNTARFHIEQHESFLAQDSILVAEPTNSGGFGLGLLATLRLNHRFELRFNPTLVFMERNLVYQQRFRDFDQGFEVTKKVESVITSFPLQVKFRSDRIQNFRVYMLAGGKLDYDLASNAKARQADDMVRINKVDYGIEAGLGFNFYMKSFIFSPEIKISNGLRNMHDRNENLRYSSVLDRIQSRMIVFSIHLEG